jgi:hypothetical protein
MRRGVPPREDLAHDCHPLGRATQAKLANYPYFTNLFHVSGSAKRSRFAPYTAPEGSPERYLGTDGFAVCSDLR